MRLDHNLKAIALGLLPLLAHPEPMTAEPLKVMTGSPTPPLNVPMNRAVVVESGAPFAELSIANPNIADISTLSDQSIYVLGKSPGRTTLTLLAADGKLITNITVQVSPDIAEFKERLAQILPGEPIEVRTANDGVVLSGSVTSKTSLDRALALAERYAPGKVSNLINVGGTQQVMLKVRFAEMSRSLSKQLSASLGFRTGTGKRLTGSGAGGTWLASGSDGAITPRSGTEGLLNIGYSAGSFELGLLLEAMEAKGYVKTLAEPTLATLSGQEASFLAGGEYPVPVAADNGQVTIQFKPFGVELSFTPQVRSGKVITLELKAAVSGIDTTSTYQSNGVSIAAFRRRETSTTVEMRDGESFAIAGLLQDDYRNLNGQIPWLGDIPVLGTLFRSAKYERRQTELMIIVTPYLAAPLGGDHVPLPTDRILPPNERDLFLKGKTASKELREVAAQDFRGPYGYVLD